MDMRGRYIPPVSRHLRVSRGAGFSLVEMLAVALIISALLAAGAGLFQRTGSEAVKTGTEKFAALVEQARTSAITRRKPVALALISPGDLSQGDELCRIGVFELEDWKSGEKVEGRLIQRWRSLPGGVGFVAGEYETLENVMDVSRPSLSWKNGDEEAEVPLLVFSARGGLMSPAGSKPVVVILSSGVHQDGRFIPRNGGGRRVIRIGRVVARPWILDV